MKKNKALGYETRFLLLGHSQLLISRDPDFNNIVNVIPLEGGYVMIKKPRDFGGLLIVTHQREYVLKFETADEMVGWYHKL
jgi:PH domain